MYLPIDELLPYINNPREHSEYQIKCLASSIKEFGFINPIIITKDKEIIAGHGRLMAAKLLNLPKVPCILVDHLTPAQIKAYRIADNRLSELGTWDQELLSIELAELREITDEPIPLEALGFSVDDLDIEDEDLEVADPEQLLNETYGIRIKCESLEEFKEAQAKLNIKKSQIKWEQLKKMLK